VRIIRPQEIKIECPHCNALLGVIKEDININMEEVAHIIVFVLVVKKEFVSMAKFPIQ